MRPLSSAMPASSKPICSTLGVIPAADKTISASFTSISPFLFRMLIFNSSPVVSTLSTVDLTITSMPAFLKERAICLETSSSSTGNTFGINSTKVTFVPMAL